MKTQIASIINTDEKELHGNLFFYWIDKGFKLAESIKDDLKRIGVHILETESLYYFITNY